MIGISKIALAFLLGLTTPGKRISSSYRQKSRISSSDRNGGDMIETNKTQEHTETHTQRKQKVPLPLAIMYSNSKDSKDSSKDSRVLTNQRKLPNKRMRDEEYNGIAEKRERTCIVFIPMGQ